MARNETQFYDPSQDEDLVSLELDGEVYNMPRSVAAQASQDFSSAGLTPGGQVRMTADEFYDEPAPKPAPRPKPRAAGPVDMDLTKDPEALAGGGPDAGIRQAFGGEADWVDALAAGPSPAPDMDFSSMPMAVPRQDDAVGRSMMHDALGSSVPQGVERLPGGPGFAQAWAGAQGRPLPAPPPGGMPGPSAPSGDPVGRSMMHDALGAASVPSRTRTISDPLPGGFPQAWSSAVAGGPMPTPAPGAAPQGRPPVQLPQINITAGQPPADMDLMNDPEALDALAAGPGPAAPPGAAPQYDMIIEPSQAELEDVRRRLAGFRVGAQ